MNEELRIYLSVTRLCAGSRQEEKRSVLIKDISMN